MARILIVEDDAMNRQVIRTLLECGDHVVEEVDDGDQALQQDLSTFDLVITDLYMPRVSGFEVILGAVAAGVPTIAVSGGDRLSGMDPLVVALEKGAVLALRKPYSAPQLLRGVAECLGTEAPHPRVIEYHRG